VGRSRPTGLRFKGLGSHRLRGLREPQALFQVVAANLRTHFPQLRILAAPAAETGERPS
jgi:class 3 adenylate cyclase